MILDGIMLRSTFLSLSPSSSSSSSLKILYSLTITHSGLSLSALIFLSANLYTLFPTKPIFILGLTLFSLGSLLCTFAPSSKIFVLGRALAGMGSSSVNAGTMLVLKRSFPLGRPAMWSGVVNGCQSVGLVIAPMVGGALLDRFGWRACFGVNLPLGVVCIGLTFYRFEAPRAMMEDAVMSLSLKEKLKRIDVFGSALIVPAITCGLMGLQWGGVMYGWKDWRIILLFSLFATLLLAFGYL
jgi:MFS family permease